MVITQRIHAPKPAIGPLSCLAHLTGCLDQNPFTVRTRPLDRLLSARPCSIAHPHSTAHPHCPLPLAVGCVVKETHCPLSPAVRQ